MYDRSSIPPFIGVVYNPGNTCKIKKNVVIFPLHIQMYLSLIHIYVYKRQEREQLFKSIKYPKLLFRYRPVSTKSLEALRTNKLYFSSANYYDDPFDTFLHIDIEAIRKEYLSAFRTPKSTEAVVESRCV